jgi:hypothetical protein
MDAELHWLDARGEPVRPPLIWKTRQGRQARLASCGEQLYLAWTTAEGALLTRAPASGQVREPMLLPRWKADLEERLGPLQCTATGASLVAGWQNPSFTLQRKVSVASIAATETVPQRGRWTTASLPGDPQSLLTPELPLAAYASATGVQVLVDEDYFVAIVGLDPVAGKTTLLPNSPKIPRGTPCLPTNDGRRVLCVSSEVSKPMPECKRYVKRLAASFVGAASFAAPAPSNVAPAPVPYFAGGGAIPDAAPRSKEDAVDRRSQLWCGEPGWDGLRKAIVAFCTELTQQRNAAKKKNERQGRADELNAYCGNDPSSLLFQASNCTDEPLTCEHPSVSDVLTVNRAEFEHGSDRLMMNVLHDCEVRFSGKGEGWRIVDHECNGD